MLDNNDKKFINEIVIGFSDEIRAIITDYSSFIERIHCDQNDKLYSISGALENINDSIRLLSSSDISYYHCGKCQEEIAHDMECPCCESD